MMVSSLLLLMMISYVSSLSLNPMQYRKMFHRYSSLIDTANTIDTTASDDCFDLRLAVILGGYSFEAYNEPPLGKVATGMDGTRIIFTSSEFIRHIFTGVVMITLERGEVSKESQKEEGLFEVISSGDLVDPYVIITVQENDKTRVIDSSTSTIKKSTGKPEWRESYFLYIIDPAYSKLNFTLMDKDYFKADDVLGHGSFSVADFLQFYPKFKSSDTKDTYHNVDNKPVKIPIPLYINDESWSLLPRPKRKRTGTLFIEASVTKFDVTPNTRPTGTKTTAKLPQGATPGSVDWVTLLSSIIENGRTVKDMKQNKENDNALSIVDSITSGLHQICSIDNPDTDTQASIWADMTKRELILSFRGTEQVKFKDILTDINLIQVPFDDSNPTLKDIKLHSGFLKAYQSVQPALLQILQALLKYKTDAENNGTPWNIYITGHSLGGALATITAFDIGRINSRLFGTNDAVLRYYDDKEFLSTLAEAKITMYTFGAPRVGDKNFRDLFNSLIPSTFRIVNNQDIVARIPRASKANRLLAYEHIGKTVMVDDEALGTLWIEGSSEGICPVSEISPYSNSATNIASNIITTDTNSNSFLKDTIKSINNNIVDSISSISENLKKNTNSNTNINININTDNKTSYNISISSDSVIDSISKAASNAAIDITNKLDQQVDSIISFSDTTQKNLFYNALNMTGIGTEGFNQLVSMYNIASDMSKGFESSFIDRELAILNALIDGRALEHHLEPSYFKALEKAILNKNNTNII